MENGPVEWIMVKPINSLQRLGKASVLLWKNMYWALLLCQDKMTQTTQTQQADTQKYEWFWNSFRRESVHCWFFFFLTQVVLFGEKKVFKLFPWTIRRSFVNKNWMSFLFFIFIFSSRCWSLIICLPDIKSHSFPSESPAKLHQIFLQITKAKR